MESCDNYLQKNIIHGVQILKLLGVFGRNKQYLLLLKQCICCAPSFDLPGLKTGLAHLPTKPWSEDGVPVLRPGRSEDGAGGRKMGQVYFLQIIHFLKF